MYAPSLFSRLMILLGLLFLSTGCMASLSDQESTGAQVVGTPVDIVVLPEPTNTSPVLPEPIGTDPYVLILTAQPTFPSETPWLTPLPVNAEGTALTATPNATEELHLEPTLFLTPAVVVTVFEGFMTGTGMKQMPLHSTESTPVP